MSHDNGNSNNNNNDDNQWDGNIYTYNGGTINEKDAEKVELVQIDESVSSIPEKAFPECKYLQTVEFSANQNILKEIGEGSFCRCRNLSSINLQDTQVEIIGDDAFFYCDKLASIQFPSSIRQIGKSCFASCNLIKVVDLSFAINLETIEAKSFSCCWALTTVKLPATTSSLGKRSFFRCTALEEVDLRATCINKIEDEAFHYCTNLTSIYLPRTINCIGKESFHDCRKLMSLDLQETSIETIERFTFKNCYNLETIYLPRTLKFIRNYSFANCKKLKHLDLRVTSTEKIGSGTFEYCTNLTTIVGKSTTNQDDVDQEIATDESVRDGSTKLPASLVELGFSTFYSCPNLKKNSIDNRWIHYQCDINRGGQRFLQRHHHHDDDSNSGDAKRHGKIYCSSLWPLILYRVMHKMELPARIICLDDDTLLLYTTKAKRLQRQASVIFHLLVHGVTPDLLQSGNVHTKPATPTRRGNFFRPSA